MIHRCEKCGNDFLTEADSYIVNPTHAGVKLYCSCQIINKENIMSEWITDRLPSSADMDYVYGADGKIKVCYNVQKGEAWKPIPEVEPYVKPKRFHITDALHVNGTRIYFVWDSVSRERCSSIFRNRKAAEQIAKICEEEMP